MLAFDEEVDFIEYQRYLRSQSNSDLGDILTHLDTLRCPRRAEAARRELCRRRLSGSDTYELSETVWRKFLILAIAVISITFWLGSTMSVEEALRPQPPPSLDLTLDGASVQFIGSPFGGGDEMKASILGVYAAQQLENAVRSAVFFLAQSGAYALLLVVTIYKVLGSITAPCNDELKAELRRLVVIALAGQALIIISTTWNNLALLADGGQAAHSGVCRAMSFLLPWA